MSVRSTENKKSKGNVTISRMDAREMRQVLWFLAKTVTFSKISR